jgi:hypothetical protein
VSVRPSPAVLLETPGAYLSRTDLAALGLPRRAVDAVFRACPVIAFEGYSRPLIRRDDFLELEQQRTYLDDRVRPTKGAGR